MCGRTPAPNGPHRPRGTGPPALSLSLPVREMKAVSRPPAQQKAFVAAVHVVARTSLARATGAWGGRAGQEGQGRGLQLAGPPEVSRPRLQELREELTSCSDPQELSVMRSGAARHLGRWGGSTPWGTRGRSGSLRQGRRHAGGVGAGWLRVISRRGSCKRNVCLDGPAALPAT